MSADSPARVLLAELGWREEFEDALPEAADKLDLVVRVVEVQRSGLRVLGADFEQELSIGGRWFQGDEQDRPVIGDWLLLDRAKSQIDAIFPRISLLQRIPPGREAQRQMIAANVDLLFLVSSCNDEFNLSRMERYLSLAFEARVAPVIVLTKADCTSTPETFIQALETLALDIPWHILNALDPEQVQVLRNYCGPGQTVALLGSSGVGKSTLINTLCGADVQLTGAIRTGDDKGRHTTTNRSLHRLPDGGLLLDSPGMRELQIAADDRALQDAFEDIDALARQCRFNDCRHGVEPGCAVQDAIADAQLAPRRLQNFSKLREQEQSARLARTRRRRGGDSKR